MKVKQILVAGVLVSIVIEIVALAFSELTQWIWKYDMLELGGMRATDDPLMVLFFIHPWVLGFALAYVYSYFNKALEGSTGRKGGIFGLFMWLVIAVPTAVIVFSTIDYPVGFMVNELISPLIYLVPAGIVIAKTFESIK